MRNYGTFDNSTNAALEADTTGNRFTRVTIGGSGATLKSNLEAARAALSTAVYAQLTAGSINGVAGYGIVQDGFARGGGNLTWTDIYQNSAMQWTATPKNRPSAAITIAGSTDINDDAGSITESLYTDAVTALEAVLSQLGTRTRVVANPWLTLVSVFNDDPLTLIGWDDHTPGQPQSLSINDQGNPQAPSSAQMSLTGNWARQYPSDGDYDMRVRFIVTQVVAGAGAGATSDDSGWQTGGGIDVIDGTWTYVTAALQGDGAQYDVQFLTQFRNPNHGGIDGAQQTFTSNNHIIFNESA